MPYLAISLIALLLGASIKDTSIISVGETPFEIVNNGLTTALKQYSSVLTIGGLIVGSFTLINERVRKKYQQNGNILFGMLIVLMFISSARASIVGENIGIKVVLGSAISIAVCMYARSAISHRGRIATAGEILSALYIYGAILVLLNIIDYIRGYGFLSESPRMLGSSSHPNFLAVQIAVEIPAFAWFCKRDRAFAIRASSIALICLAMFLMVQTGSRTGLTIVAGEVFIVVWIMKKLPALPAIVVPAVAIAMAFLLINSFDLGALNGTFDRGGDANTRDETWRIMLYQISENPIFGYGQALLASENSFLRGWVMYGFIYAFLLATFSIYLAYSLIDKALTAGCPDLLPIAAIVGGLLFGSAFEGYLTDSFTVPVILIAVAAALADSTGSSHAFSGSKARQPDVRFQGNQFYRSSRNS